MEVKRKAHPKLGLGPSGFGWENMDEEAIPWKAPLRTRINTRTDVLLSTKLASSASY